MCVFFAAGVGYFRLAVVPLATLPTRQRLNGHGLQSPPAHLRSKTIFNLLFPHHHHPPPPSSTHPFLVPSALSYIERPLHNSISTASIQSLTKHPRAPRFATPTLSFLLAPPRPMPSLTAPTSPGARARSVSQPLRDGVDPDVFRFGTAGQTSPRSSFHRTLSANTAYGSYGRASGSGLSGQTKGRNRSGSLVTVTEVGGDEPDNINDRLGVGANFNAAWVNAPGK